MSFEEIVEAAVARGVAKALSSVRAPDAAGHLTVAEAAKLAHVSEPTIRSWVAEGILPRYGSARALRVRRDDVLSVRPKSPAAEKSTEELAQELLNRPRRR